MLPLLALALACSEQKRTEIIVGIATDLTAPAPLKEVDLGVVRLPDNAPVGSKVFTVSGSPLQPYDIPGTYAVYSSAGTPDRVKVTLLAKDQNGATLIVRTAVLSLVPHRTLFARLGVVSACQGKSDCADGDTCIDGRCQSEVIDTSRLPDYQPGMESTLACASATRYIDTNTGTPLAVAAGPTCDPALCQEGVCLAPVALPAGSVGGACATNDECVARPDAGPGFTCTADHRCVNVAQNLAGLVWTLPCTSTGTTCSTAANRTASAVIGGAAGVTYDVTLHIRGVVEAKTYRGGCGAMGASWIAGGTPSTDTFNVYRLQVSSPPQTYYLNAGTSGISNCVPLDYVQVVRADAGATVTVDAESIDDLQISNVDASGLPITVPGATVVQPFNGQFVEADVVSVVPEVAATVVPTHAPAGHALGFSGGQVATVADDPTLHPADLTVEGWFQFAAANGGAFNTIVAKAFGAGTADSFALWYQGALFGGASVNNTSDAATVPWTPAAEWHHAAVTYDSVAGVATLYTDGTQAACAPRPGPITYDTQPLQFGADTDDGGVTGYFEGALDELRLFSTARTPAQIWSDMNTHTLGPTPGLLGEWTFEEAAGQTAADSSGQAHPAVLGTTPAVEPSDPAWVPVTP